MDIEIPIPEEEYVRELEYRKCAESVAYFYFNYWHIDVPNRVATLPDDRPAQREALEKFQEKSLVVCLKSRQIGWTTIGSCFAFWCAAFAPEGEARQCFVLSRTQREAADDVKRKISFGYEYLPDWMRRRLPKVIKSNRLEMEFEGGSRVVTGPSKSNPARGKSPYVIMIDEWAFIENPSEAWNSIKPAAEHGGRVIGFSTPDHMGSWFHRFWIKAKDGVTGFAPLFLSWRAVPNRDDAWYARQLAEDPELTRVEYADNDVECWMSSGSSFFESSEVPSPDSLSDPMFYGEVLRGGEGRTYCIDSPNGIHAIYEPPEKDALYVIGADVAGGSEEGDYSVATVLSDDGREVAQLRCHMQPDEFGRQISLLGRWYNNALVGVERNNMGPTTIKALISDSYPNLYYDRKPLPASRGYKPRVGGPGWTTTNESKHRMLTHLKTALRSGEAVVASKDTAEELIAFQRKVKKVNGVERIQYSGSPHDDCVISFAIAYQMLPFLGRAPVRKHQPTPEQMSFSELRELVPQTNTRKGRVFSGYG